MRGGFSTILNILVILIFKCIFYVRKNHLQKKVCKSLYEFINLDNIMVFKNKHRSDYNLNICKLTYLSIFYNIVKMSYLIKLTI